MNVLVVGGAGYIGSHCVRQLEIAGHTPVVVDNLIYGHKASISSKVPFYEVDMADEEKVKEILQKEKIDLVMHFAAFAFVGESVTEPLKYYMNNVVATLKLLKVMLECDIKKFVFSSTCATYGEATTLPLVEDHPQQPINPYGQTKLDIENALKAFSHAYGLSFASFRYFNASGAATDGTIGEDHNPETHLIPLAISAALGQRPPLKVFGTDYDTPDGTCLRDYIHVDDLSRAHIAAFPKLEKAGTQLFYNLGTGTPFSVREVLQTIEEVSGKKVPFEEAERRPGDPAALYADSIRAQKELNWEIKFPDLKSIIETAWNWHSKNPNGYSK